MKVIWLVESNSLILKSMTIMEKRTVWDNMWCTTRGNFRTATLHNLYKQFKPGIGSNKGNPVCRWHKLIFLDDVKAVFLKTNLKLRKFLNSFRLINIKRNLKVKAKPHLHFFIGLRIETTYPYAYQFQKLVIVT